MPPLKKVSTEKKTKETAEKAKKTAKTTKKLENRPDSAWVRTQTAEGWKRSIAKAVDKKVPKKTKKVK